MNQEVGMNTLADEINSQITAGRAAIRRSVNEGQMAVGRVPRAGWVAAGLFACGVALGVGWMVYGSRRHRTLVRRLHDAFQEGVRDLPAELRAQVKKVRAV
jgi:hypothetical protein